KYKIFSILLCANVLFVNSQSIDPLLSIDKQNQIIWVDSVYNSLSLDEKIGQLFFVQTTSKKSNNSKEIIKLINNYKIGGIILSTGNPTTQVNFTNKFQQITKTPLLVSMDAEWGVGMRLDSIQKFPWNMSLGAIKDNSIIKQIGVEVGKQCERLGIHMNFAPVVDINTNSNNPIIGNRAYGEDKYNVTEKGIAFTIGMQSRNILATAKHFPGHGDTSKDSHKTLPTINFQKKRIFNTELYPYKKLIDNGLAAIMIAHLNVPSLEKERNLPSSLSKEIIEETLIKKLNFNGLIITDALEMKGVSDYSKKNIDLLAFLAGNDILLMSSDVSKGIKSIKKSYNKGNISEERLSRSVKKILKAKYKVGLHEYTSVIPAGIVKDLNNSSARNTIMNSIKEIPVLIKNNENNLPLNLNLNKTINIQIGNDNGRAFNEYINKYSNVKSIKASDLNDLEIEGLLENYDNVIVSLHYLSKTPWDNMNLKISEADRNYLRILKKHNNKTLVSFTNPYTLSQIDLDSYNSVLIGFQNNTEFQKIVAQQIFGALEINGLLPVSINKNFMKGTGIKTEALNILSYAEPETVGMDNDVLKKIDSIINYAINNEMTPGAQILVAKDSKIIYDKSFGKLRYNENSIINDETIYDLASLTKILVTTPILMNLIDDNIVNLETRLGEIIPRYQNSNKKNITLKELFSGHAALQAWIPFYKETLDKENKPSEKYYLLKETNSNTVKVSPNMYLKSDYLDTIRNMIRDSDLLEKKYKYSDLTYLIIQEFIENHYNVNLEMIINDLFFQKLGINLNYNPAEKYSTKNIAPTEIDEYFRYKEVHGYVHDMAAAMFGGVSAHAGLFGNSINVAKVMQMYLQGGNYAGMQIINSDTIDLFNNCYYCHEENRRGVGFDKPQLEEDGPTCGCVSMDSFGHSGWTGTFTWADPEKNIVYVFLSNRSYPSGVTAGKSLLVKENIRSEIQKIIYQSIKE
ncbi:MAG: glycoside hydrolase family 3 N-terminal domain-containing protein, partial [Flavobacteriaceae bacterium]